MMKKLVSRLSVQREPLLRAGFYVAIILLAAFSAVAQTQRPNFNRPQTFDAQHYVIRATFDRVNKKVFGDTTISLKPLINGFTTVELDAIGLNFQTVKLEPSGADLKFRTLPGKVVITLDNAYSKDELVTISLKYAASPKKGVYFVAAQSDNGGNEIHSDQIWTQGEPDEARHWFPSFDFPGDKATTEQFITAEKGETVVGNGELVEKIQNGDGPSATVIWHYNMHVPLPVYLVSFVVGKYVKLEEKYKNIPLGYYIYPGREQTARNAYADTAAMMKYFEQQTGVDFPYNKYDQTVVAGFEFGGMENITATTMADTFIFLADTEFGRNEVMDLVSHELAHSWFGNLVTCRNWAELWLNEGFATYMEAAFREKKYGREDYLRKVQLDAAEFIIDDAISRKRHPLYNLRAGKVAELFDNSATTYHKGGAVLHTLREQIGARAFWSGVNIYLNRHKFGSVESTDLRKAMEEASGESLGWFFDQWIYSGGLPKLTIRQIYNAKAKTLTLVTMQTQKPDVITPTVFRVPLEVVIKKAGTEQIEKIEITKRRQFFNFKISTRPQEIVVDPELKIPIKRVDLRPIELGVAQNN
jgi:aminopeptidase N